MLFHLVKQKDLNKLQTSPLTDSGAVFSPKRAPQVQVKHMVTRPRGGGASFNGEHLFVCCLLVHNQEINDFSILSLCYRMK